MRRVLLVEDQADIREVIAAFLEDLGFAVEAVEDGEQALERMRARAPDCVLLDLMLPRLTGQEVLRAMRGDPALARVPVISMSAVYPLELSPELTTTTFLRKPFALERLQEVLERVLDEGEP